jgi:hypothetical protein
LAGEELQLIILVFVASFHTPDAQLDENVLKERRRVSLAWFLLFRDLVLACASLPLPLFFIPNITFTKTRP